MENNNFEIKPNGLFQNSPNPFSKETVIKIQLNENVNNASLLITNLNGQMVKEIPLNERGLLQVEIGRSELAAGIYNYSLLADRKLIDTKKMVLTP